MEKNLFAKKFYIFFFFSLAVIGDGGVRKLPESLKIIKAEYRRTELMIPQNNHSHTYFLIFVTTFVGWVV